MGLVMDAWKEGGANESRATVTLTKGKPCALRIEYFEARMMAYLRFRGGLEGEGPAVDIPPDMLFHTKGRREKATPRSQPAPAEPPPSAARDSFGPRE